MDRKAQKKLERKLERAGWRLERNKAGVKCFSPDGERIVLMHKAHKQSDHRGTKNLMAEFRRAGFDPNG